VREYNIKMDMPSVEIAVKRLDAIIQEARYQRLKIIKIIHGYGSSGVGGKIKTFIQQSLREKYNKKVIKAYIPGEAFCELLGFDYEITKYKGLINRDNESLICNNGITYIII